MRVPRELRLDLLLAALLGDLVAIAGPVLGGSAPASRSEQMRLPVLRGARLPLPGGVLITTALMIGEIRPLRPQLLL